jgi:putative alpha-1,2-mannosidase
MEINPGNSGLEIQTLNYAPENSYVRNIWLNDSLLDRTSIKHNEIMNGGILKFEMSSTPVVKN